MGSGKEELERFFKRIYDRLKEIDRLIEHIDDRADRGIYHDNHDFGRDMEKREELQLERVTLNWVLADF